MFASSIAEGQGSCFEYRTPHQTCSSPSGSMRKGSLCRRLSLAASSNSFYLFYLFVFNLMISLCLDLIFLALRYSLCWCPGPSTTGPSLQRPFGRWRLLSGLWRFHFHFFITIFGYSFVWITTSWGSLMTVARGRTWGCLTYCLTFWCTYWFHLAVGCFNCPCIIVFLHFSLCSKSSPETLGALLAINFYYPRVWGKERLSSMYSVLICFWFLCLSLTG